MAKHGERAQKHAKEIRKFQDARKLENRMEEQALQNERERYAERPSPLERNKNPRAKRGGT